MSRGVVKLNASRRRAGAANTADARQRVERSTVRHPIGPTSNSSSVVGTVLTTRAPGQYHHRPPTHAAPSR
jgi:hypothetical protein